MKTLNAPIENFIKTSKTEVATDVSAGSSVAISVKNSNEFAVNDFICVGTIGNETSEVAKISSISGNVVTVATLALAHKKDDPIVKLLFNQRKLYGCATKTGTYVEIETKDIEVDTPQGTSFEYTGDYIYFKCTYLNEHTVVESSIDDAVAVLGGESDRYCSIFNIKSHAGLVDNEYIDSSRIEAKREQAENEINSVLFTRYTLPLSEIPALVTRIAILLAAGYIDYEEFGAEGEGKKWLGEARGILKSIQNGTQRLIKADNTEMETISGGDVLNGYPDSDGVSDTDLAERMFSGDDKY